MVTANLNSVYFVSESQGWAVGASGKILTTTDGGFTWTQQTSGTTMMLNSVHFVSPLQGWIVGGNGIILTTTDGGATWSPQNWLSPVSLSGVYFPTPDHGWAVGNSGRIIRYTSPLGINELNANTTTSIYPNPASGTVTVQTADKIDMISVYNTIGALVQTEVKNTFSVAQLPAGMYMLYIRTDKGTSTASFIKE
jgi:hypothetical protein